MILLGGSSMHKGANGWNAARAISCLPALTGDFGLPGGGLGPRHGAQSAGFRNLSAPESRPPGNYIPNQMPDITEALSNGQLKVLLLLGTNMLSSFADAGQVADGQRDPSHRAARQNARFPVLKTMEDFEWNWPKKINRPHPEPLPSGIHRRQYQRRLH
jgi:hypothetical protein